MAERAWLVVSVRAPSEAQVEALIEGLVALGAQAVQQTNGELLTYLEPPADLPTWTSAAEVRLGVPVTTRFESDQDWSESWKRGLQPRRVGRNLIVAPSWTSPEVRAGDRVIVIDPEMAFGTGEHATTRGALRFLEQMVRPGHRVLDVGTGSAILAIGAALCGADYVLGVEYDQDAIINARDNIVRNGVADRVTLDTALVDDAYLAHHGEQAWEGIAANVLSGVLRPLLPAFRRALKTNGYLVLGGILEQEADDMIDAATAAGFTLLAEDLEEEWWGGLLQRRESD